MAGPDFRDRIGWEKYLRPFLFKDLPPDTGWSATLGTLSLLLFGLMAVTGVILAMFYNPSPDKAYQSIDFIMKDVPLGAVLRGLHHWGAGALVLVVFLHLLSTYFSGSYQSPRELTWVVGVCLFLITLGLGFTGYLLPWDMKAYWATVVSSNIPRHLPVIGKFSTGIMLGGQTVSGFTLTRFYAVHTLLLPALLAGCAFLHIYFVRLHGLAEDPEKQPARAAAGQQTYRFFPEHAFRSALVFSGVLLILIGLSVFARIPREQIAGTFIESYLPRPEWYFMWLFQLLTFFAGAWETVGSLVIPVVGVVVLFALPFLSKGTGRGLANRPLAAAVGVTAVIAIIYLSVMGFVGTLPYGQIIPVPQRPLTEGEARGLSLFVDRECAYCHQIEGRGGLRVGPDLSNILAKGRDVDYLVKFLKDPQAVSSTSIMPKYNLPEKDRRDLAEFILALDFRRYPMKILKRDEVPKLSTPGRTQQPSLRPGAPEMR
ncbi:MAG: cytochrome b N-terminal domain-containing protein [Desulfobaccales bacterium]|jgi:ubiquinol-cytochrome c reductase cytochrome b subunit